MIRSWRNSKVKCVLSAPWLRITSIIICDTSVKGLLIVETVQRERGWKGCQNKNLRRETHRVPISYEAEHRWNQTTKRTETVQDKHSTPPIQTHSTSMNIVYVTCETLYRAVNTTKNNRIMLQPGIHTYSRSRDRVSKGLTGKTLYFVDTKINTCVSWPTLTRCKLLNDQWLNKFVDTKNNTSILWQTLTGCKLVNQMISDNNNNNKKEQQQKRTKNKGENKLSTLKIRTL